MTDVVYNMSTPVREDPPTPWSFTEGTSVEAAVVQFASHIAWKDPDNFAVVKVEGHGVYRVLVEKEKPYCACSSPGCSICHP